MTMIDLHHVCKTEPVCECADEPYSCECYAVDRSGLTTTCAECRAEMVAIDCDSGEEIAA